MGRGDLDGTLFSLSGQAIERKLGSQSVEAAMSESSQISSTA